MPGLLTPEHVATRAHGLGHVLVPHRRLDHLDACLTHGHVETLVRHHRDHHRLAGQPARLLQLDGEHGQDLVPVQWLPVGVHREAAVGVTVVSDARVRAVLGDRVDQGAKRGGAAAGVDVQPVWFGSDGDDVRAGPAQRLRCDQVRGPVCAVGHHPQPGERLRLGQRGQQVIQVPAGLTGGVADPAEIRTGRRLRRARLRRARLGRARFRCARARPSQHGGPQVERHQVSLDLVFHRVGQLDATGPEELDPVVLGRVVTRRDNDAERRVQRAGQVRHARRGDDPEAQDVHPRARQPRGHGGLQELPRGPRIPADDGQPTRCRVARRAAAENSGSGHAEVHGQPCG